MSGSRVSVAVVVLMLICVAGVGQDKDEKLSDGRPNGRLYLKSDDLGRIEFLWGIGQGIGLLADEGAISKETMDSYNVKGFGLGDIKDQVDKLYQDRANIRIPISYAYLYAVRRARRDPPNELEDFLARLRKRFVEK